MRLKLLFPNVEPTKYKKPRKCPTEPVVTVEEITCVLDVGRLLLSVLTHEELEELQALLIGEPFIIQVDNTKPELGNTGVT